MPIDHSLTYKTLNFRNIPHIQRFYSLKKIIYKMDLDNVQNYLDIGCSNGFLTNEIQNIVRAQHVVGADHHEENLKIAQERYPKICFEYIDLNSEIKLNEKFDFITCLETLEHTGNMLNAVQQTLNQLSQKGQLLVTVPIEIGLIGMIKFLIKNFIYKDNFKEISTETNIKLQYFLTLLKGNKISIFRDPLKKGYGTHYGFDYRDIDDFLKQKQINYKRFRSFTTMYYIIECRDNIN